MDAGSPALSRPLRSLGGARDALLAVARMHRGAAARARASCNQATADQLDHIAADFERRAGLQ